MLDSGSSLHNAHDEINVIHTLILHDEDTGNVIHYSSVPSPSIVLQH